MPRCSGTPLDACRRDRSERALATPEFVCDLQSANVATVPWPTADERRRDPRKVAVVDDLAPLEPAALLVHDGSTYPSSKRPRPTSE